MTAQSKGTGSGPSSPPETEFQEFVIPRDKDRPLSFAGMVLAKATRGGNPIVGMEILEAALYRTRGGKFITSLRKYAEPALDLSALMNPLGDEESPKSGFNKAAVHDTFESAMAWFRPGRLTDELRRQLGLDKPERIE